VKFISDNGALALFQQPEEVLKQIKVKDYSGLVPIKKASDSTFGTLKSTLKMKSLGLFKGSSDEEKDISVPSSSSKESEGTLKSPVKAKKGNTSRYVTNKSQRTKKPLFRMRNK
jgi:hypothetical protein